VVIIEERSYVDEVRPTSVEPSADVDADVRPRDDRGHCWDGLHCDHLDHGAEGVIHFIR
jgi:hypothetical protein